MWKDVSTSVSTSFQNQRRVEIKWKNISAFISTPRQLEGTLPGIASRFGRASLDRAENFHANFPSTWINSGCGAPIPEWHPPGRDKIAGDRAARPRHAQRLRRNGAGVADRCNPEDAWLHFILISGKPVSVPGIL
jgi:hypothetical protein